MKVLIIEDDDGYAELISKYIDGIAEISVAKQWDEAYRVLDESNPDVVWVDLIVPGETIETAFLRVAEVRRRNAETVILVVSGHADHDVHKRALAAGADAYADKFDIGKRNQVVALVILALLNAKRRGANTEEFLLRAQKFLAEEVKPNQAAKSKP